MFYPEAMNKARVRVASVRMKYGISQSEVNMCLHQSREYAREMRCDAEPDDDGVLQFFYADAVDLFDIEMVRELRQVALARLFEWAREADDFAPIITDRVH